MYFLIILTFPLTYLSILLHSPKTSFVVSTTGSVFVLLTALIPSIRLALTLNLLWKNEWI
jgi:hypothetical protein